MNIHESMLGEYQWWAQQDSNLRPRDYECSEWVNPDRACHAVSKQIQLLEIFHTSHFQPGER
ncbi:hypothetical protein [Salinicola sp. NYA28a]